MSIFFGLLINLVFLLQTEDLNTLLTDAELAYRTGDYTTAITLYETALTLTGPEPTILFNLGNAYFEDNQLGLALLNYRRALILAPRDVQINANLLRVRSARANFQQDDVDLLNRLAASTYSSLTLTELGWIALITWSGTFVIGTTIVIRRSVGRWLMVPLAGAVIAAALISGLFWARNHVDYARPAAVVTALRAEIMSGPDDSFLQIFDLYSAAEIRILETIGGWSRFSLPDGRQGWISRFDYTLIN